MELLGLLCYAFAVIDFAGMFFGYDLTGVSWSPIVAAGLGQVFMNIGNKEEDAEKKSAQS